MPELKARSKLFAAPTAADNNAATVLVVAPGAFSISLRFTQHTARLCETEPRERDVVRWHLGRPSVWCGAISVAAEFMVIRSELARALAFTV
jgi:hypothetical protein